MNGKARTAEWGEHDMENMENGGSMEVEVDVQVS
jgi:hypothetical protein